jgi:dipeptidase D
MKLENLESILVWRYFDAIRKIPRASGKEEGVRKYLFKEAERLGMTAVQDKTGNVVIKVPASKGCENAKVTVLQNHMDMVCEKKPDKVINFDRDPIEIEITDDFARAKGTSLGADNGIGMAAALALLEDASTVHGPLELLFTVEEETGLTGAFGIDAGMLAGRRMLNLDSEEDGVIYVGCAGGSDTTINLTLTRTQSSHDAWPYMIAISKLKGGHSGLNIIENRANAIKLLAQILAHARSLNPDFALTDISGGTKRNAIPREAHALLRLKNIASFKKAIESCLASFKSIYAAIDPDIHISFQPRTAGVDEMVLDQPSRDMLIDMLIGLPNGVSSMSRDIRGLVETSSNLAIIGISENDTVIQMNTRSSNMQALNAAQEQIFSVAHLAGAKTAKGGTYPGWQPDMNSHLLNTAKEVYNKLYGKHPEVTAIHAGLECGIIGEKFSGMQMISFGPDIKGAHSPDECVNIPSVNRFFMYLKALLKTLASE